MMKKDPVSVRLYGFSILHLMIIKRPYIFRCLDCNAEVSAKVKSALGRDVTFFFSFFNKYNIKPYLISQSTTKMDT